MNLLEKFKCITKDDSGAVTVDWVVLTAAIVVIGAGTISVISPGLTAGSDHIRDKLVSADPL